jgi:SAM-dependent methyltransferase
VATPTQQWETDAVGNDEGALRRHELQELLLRPHTERLLWDAGVGPGMRVLDVGCGAGDVSVLLADLVGPSGEVVAVDRSSQALASAERRVGARGLRQIRFVEGDAGSMTFDDPFDAIVGRFVLLQAPAPAVLLRRLIDALRPNGIVACQELVQPAGALAAPPRPLLARVGGWIAGGTTAAGMSADLGLSLPAIFVEAGLPMPSLRIDGVVSLDADPLLTELAVEIVRKLLPAIERGGVATADAIALDTLADRLLAEQRELGGVICPVLLGGAYVRTPRAYGHPGGVVVGNTSSDPRCRVRSGSRS